MAVMKQRPHSDSVALPNDLKTTGHGFQHADRHDDRCRQADGSISNCVRTRLLSVTVSSCGHETRLTSEDLFFRRLLRLDDPWAQEQLAAHLFLQSSSERKAPQKRRYFSFRLWISWCSHGVSFRSSSCAQDDGSQEAERVRSWCSVIPGDASASVVLKLPPTTSPSQERCAARATRPWVVLGSRARVSV